MDNTFSDTPLETKWVGHSDGFNNSNKFVDRQYHERTHYYYSDFVKFLLVKIARAKFDELNTKLLKKRMGTYFKKLVFSYLKKKKIKCIYCFNVSLKQSATLNQ